MAIRFTIPKPSKEWRAVVPHAEVNKYLQAGFSLSPKLRFGKCVLTKKKKAWEQFEEEVLLFAEHALKLESVDGGPACRLGGYQLDVIGGLGDTFLVFECKSKKELGRRSLRTDLKALWMKKSEVSRVIRKRYGKKYNARKFIMILRGITPSDSDVSYARKKGITIWPESYFDSVRALYLMIGERVRYYVLRELGGKPPRVGSGRGSYFELPAMAANYHGESLYAAFVPVRTLLDVAYVLRVESGQKRAYQRFLDRGRLASIARFLEGGNSFKNSILLGLDKRSQFISKSARWTKNAPFRPTIGVLRIPRSFASAWVIDGQHRLYGYARTSASLLDHVLPVIAIKAKSRAEEAKIFIQINQNQKPVNPNLIWALLGILKPDSTEGLISEVVKVIAEKHGFFNGKIYVPGLSKHGRRHYQVFHANFCQTINDHFVRGRKKGFALLPDEEVRKPTTRATLIKRVVRLFDAYFTALGDIAREHNATEWVRGFLITNNGVNVMCRVLVQVLRHTGGIFTKTSFRARLATPIGDYFSDRIGAIDMIRRTTSSEGTRDQEAARVVSAIARQVDGFAADYLKAHRMGLQAEEPYRLLKSLEEALRKTISECMNEISPSWWKQRVPEDVRTNAHLRKQNREQPWPWLDTKEYPLVNYIDFADYTKIIGRNDNWREAFQAVFRDREAVVVKLKELEQIRNDIAHSRELSDFQLDMLRFNVRYLTAALNGYTPKKATQAAAAAIAAG